MGNVVHSVQIVVVRIENSGLLLVVRWNWKGIR